MIYRAASFPPARGAITDLMMVLVWLAALPTGRQGRWAVIRCAQAPGLVPGGPRVKDGIDTPGPESGRRGGNPGLERPGVVNVWPLPSQAYGEGMINDVPDCQADNCSTGARLDSTNNSTHDDNDVDHSCIAVTVQVPKNFCLIWKEAEVTCSMM